MRLELRVDGLFMAAFVKGYELGQEIIINTGIR